MVGIVEARHVVDYVIWLRFSDGLAGEVDLRDELHGEVFEPLKDPDVFRAFAVQPEWRTIAWPNGADFAPEFLHEAVQARLARGSTAPTATDAL